MDFDEYNKSFDEILEEIDEEAENRLKYIRQSVTQFLERLDKRQREWDETFQELLLKSQEESQWLANKLGNFDAQKESLYELNSQKKPQSFTDFATKEELAVEPIKQEIELPTSENKPADNKLKETKHVSFACPEKKFDDPDFSNFRSLKEFVRIQELLKNITNSFNDITTNHAVKSFKNELNLFIRTQINSISNSDSQHLATKTRLLTDLFKGRKVLFQGKYVDASQHPQGQAFSMDLAAQTFVTVGTRLVNSVPGIARSMAIVINAIASNDLAILKDLVIGHLQQRCPYLVPMNPCMDDFGGEIGQEVKFKIACGYSFDSKTQTLENEEKYLARMRSMALIYVCVLMQGHISQAWGWLAAFLSLKPQPVISATILQAFLQESSQKMSSIYGQQYMKIIAFMRVHYVKLVDEVTPKTSDRQSFIKLKNFLSDDTNLIAPPTIGSIFRTIRSA